MTDEPLTEQEVHAQNLRDLKLIREDPAWALSRVQEARRLKQRLAESEREHAIEVRRLVHSRESIRHEAQERLAEAERERDGARMVGASWHGEWFNEAGRREVAEGQLAEARVALERINRHPPGDPTWARNVAREALKAMESDASS